MACEYGRLCPLIRVTKQIRPDGDAPVFCNYCHKYALVTQYDVFPTGEPITSNTTKPSRLDTEEK